MLIAVGSTNPTKVRPVKTVFAHYFGIVKVKGVSVDSGVPEQPMGDEQTYQGALNRAQRALAKVPGAEYGVGIEGGLAQRSYGWFEYSQVVIVNRKGETGMGASSGLVLPNSVLQRIHQGENLEQAIDALFGTQQIGEGIGMFGVMTNRYVTRAVSVKQGVAFALARFLHADLYTA